MTAPNAATTESTPDWESRVEPYHAAIVFGTALLVRLWIIHAYPIIFGGDSIVRLYYHDRVLLSYQLPMLQGAVHFIMGLTDDPLCIRYFTALAGAGASVGFYYLCTRLLGRTSALAPAVWFAIHPFVVAYSTVPYQEILMLAGLFFAFVFFFDERWWLASLWLGFACLSRYEAWGAAAILAGAYWLQHDRKTSEALKAVCLFGWAPLLWIAYHQGLSPSGSFVLDAAFNWDRLWRYVYLGYITVKDTPFPVFILAGFGVWQVWRQRLWNSPRYAALAIFVAAFGIAILFSGHGERDQPDRWVTAREAHILFAATVFLAGLGFSRIRRGRAAIWIACVAVGLFMADRFVARETSDPHLQLSYSLATWIDSNVDEAEQVVILTAPLPDNASEGFLNNAERTGGSPGRRQALALLADINPAPPDFQRTVVHSRLGLAQLHNLSTVPLPERDRTAFADETRRLHGDRLLTRPPDWVAVWSDFKPTTDAETEIINLIVIDQPVHTLTEGALSVQIFRLGEN